MLLQFDKAEGDRKTLVRRKTQQQLYREKILRNPPEQYWQQSRHDYRCFTECSKLLLSEDRRHNIINPPCQCCTEIA